MAGIPQHCEQPLEESHGTEVVDVAAYARHSTRSGSHVRLAAHPCGQRSGCGRIASGRSRPVGAQREREGRRPRRDGS